MNPVIEAETGPAAYSFLEVLDAKLLDGAPSTRRPLYSSIFLHCVSTPIPHIPYHVRLGCLYADVFKCVG